MLYGLVLRMDRKKFIVTVVSMVDVGDSALIVGQVDRVVPPKNPTALSSAWHEVIELGQIDEPGWEQQLAPASQSISTSRTSWDGTRIFIRNSRMARGCDDLYMSLPVNQLRWMMISNTGQFIERALYVWDQRVS